MHKCLIFDADDALWENNVYFLRAIEEFLEVIADIAADREEILRVLTQVERELIPQGGYGTGNFLKALKETFRRFYAGADGAGTLSNIEEIGTRLRSHPMQLLPGVSAILAELRQKHRLMVFTKGEHGEQTRKVMRSGLQEYFDWVEIVREKDTAAYHGLIKTRGLRPNRTVMIGNSPRSDVTPSLAAGLWAIYIPHPHTWDLEHEDVEHHPRLFKANSIHEVPALVERI